jgi:Zn-dependent protease
LPPDDSAAAAPVTAATLAPPVESGAATARGLLVRGGLLALAAAKAGKIGLTAGTMIVSIAAYSLLFGWPYAVGFVLLIFVHEMGHFLAARQRGLDVGAPTFIPFFGAWVALKDKPMNAETEAYVGLAGPVAGTIASVICYLAGAALASPLLLALSYAGLFINLFNLVPVSPFDGGRITAVLSPRVWLIGAPILLGLFVWQRSPLLIVMLILAAPQVMAAFRYDPHAPQNAAYYATSTRIKLIYGGLYLGLVGFLALSSYEIHQMLQAPR